MPGRGPRPARAAAERGRGRARGRLAGDPRGDGKPGSGREVPGRQPYSVGPGDVESSRHPWHPLLLPVEPRQTIELAFENALLPRNTPRSSDRAQGLTPAAEGRSSTGGGPLGEIGPTGTTLRARGSRSELGRTGPGASGRRGPLSSGPLRAPGRAASGVRHPSDAWPHPSRKSHRSSQRGTARARAWPFRRKRGARRAVRDVRAMAIRIRDHAPRNRSGPSPVHRS